MPPIIEASHLGKTYRSGKLEVPALRDVSFAVEPGEFVSIVGPSGSGKSTLFYVLGGLTSPTAGTLTIRGEDFSRLGYAQRTKLRRAHIGFVFQRFNLLPTISAQDNIELAHDIADILKKQASSPAGASSAETAIPEISELEGLTDAEIEAALNALLSDRGVQ